MVPTATLIRSPDAAELLGVDTREVLDLIVAGELEPVRRPDDLYVRARTSRPSERAAPPTLAAMESR